MAEITATDLRKVFAGTAGTPAVDGVSLHVNQSEMLVLLGPSGCGKTTTLRCVAGLERPDSGTITFGSRVVYDSKQRVDVPTFRRNIGMVFQSFALWPHMTAAKNIAFPLKMQKVAKRERIERVEAIAEVVDLRPEILVKRPGQLSGGQQQRVALARALVAEPAIVLFDEPLSNLDALLREQLRQYLKDMHKRIGFTGIYVTHDLSEALVLGDSVAVMHEGGISQVGTPKSIFERPVDRRVARLLGFQSVGWIDSGAHPARWSAANGLGLEGVPTNTGNAPDRLEMLLEPTAIRILPGRVRVADGVGFTGATVARISDAGRVREVSVRVGDGASLNVRDEDGLSAPVGSEVTLRIDLDRVGFFDEQGVRWFVEGTGGPWHRADWPDVSPNELLALAT